MVDIPTTRSNIDEFAHNEQKIIQSAVGLICRDLVPLTPEVASIPMPKHINMHRLRTEHRVYELPDSHPLLKGVCLFYDVPVTSMLTNSICGWMSENLMILPLTYLLYDSRVKLQVQLNRSLEEQYWYLQIPRRTAMRGRFPLNGTYFQVNEVFADNETSQCPIAVPRQSIWALRRRTVYFGAWIPSIFKDLTPEEIQDCFWKGYVCLRGFDPKRRVPCPLIDSFHSMAGKQKGQMS